VAAGETTVEQPTILMDPAAQDPMGEMLHRAKSGASLQRLIQQSGVSLTVTNFFAVTLLLALVGAVIGWLVRPLGFLSISVIGAAVLVGSIPYMFVGIRRSKRMAEFESQLPEALDFLARSMRAGHAFSISLEMLGDEVPDPLGQEFRVLFNEQNLGAPMDVA